MRSDLRPQLNKAYGQKFMHTPAFDKFADEALTFDYACQLPQPQCWLCREGSLSVQTATLLTPALCADTNFGICSASRNSFMTGRAPDKTRVWNFINGERSNSSSALCTCCAGASALSARAVPVRALATRLTALTLAGRLSAGRHGGRRPRPAVGEHARVLRQAQLHHARPRQALPVSVPASSPLRLSWQI